MLNKAKAGEIYVDPNAMDMVFRDAVMNPTVEQLWQAQLNLWVTADIVAAIKATNNEAFASSDAQGKPHSVLTGAVKRLVQVRVNETYVRPAAGEAAAVAVPARGYSEEVPDVGGSDMSGRSAVAGAEGSEQADPLTGRGSSKEYDVLHYRFSVVMPTRYLPALQRNLMAQNYHTILKVDFYTPGAAGAGYGAASPEVSGVASSYYYGVEPVVQVDITGELLLLTTWERGAPEAQGEEIHFPPLMPVEVLATQFSGPNNAALREVDISRMPQTTAEPGAAELEY
jgi:hypothetical protein